MYLPTRRHSQQMHRYILVKIHQHILVWNLCHHEKRQPQWREQEVRWSWSSWYCYRSGHSDKALHCLYTFFYNFIMEFSKILGFLDIKVSEYSEIICSFPIQIVKVEHGRLSWWVERFSSVLCWTICENIPELARTVSARMKTSQLCYCSLIESFQTLDTVPSWSLIYNQWNTGVTSNILFKYIKIQS